MSRTDIIEWVPACRPCATERGRADELVGLGPNPHPCRRCGVDTSTAIRVVRS